MAGIVKISRAIWDRFLWRKSSKWSTQYCSGPEWRSSSVSRARYRSNSSRSSPMSLWHFFCFQLGKVPKSHKVSRLLLSAVGDLMGIVRGSSVSGWSVTSGLYSVFQTLCTILFAFSIQSGHSSHSLSKYLYFISGCKVTATKCAGTRSVNV